MIKKAETIIPAFMKLVIVVLCLYVGVRCINLITNNKSKETIGKVTKDTTEIIAKEIVENGSIMNEYMLYLENHSSMDEVAKKKLLNAIVSEYITDSEYTYDTSDPSYEQVVNLIYENADYVEETTTAENETKQKKKSVEASAQVIVPMPKIEGTL
jgi:hypothetical protein